MPVPPNETRAARDHRRTDEALGSVDYADAVARRTPHIPIQPVATAHGWRESSLVQLVLVRFREFLREPEAVFWSFVFPLLLAAGLGLAFRHRPPDRIPVAVVVDPGAAVAAESDDPVGAAIGRSEARTLADRLAADSALRVRPLGAAGAERALRNGDVALVVAPTAEGGVEYRYDPTREEARVARLIVDRGVQASAGRTDPVPVAERTVQEPGSRYIDFFVPGLLGMNLMGSGIWGIGFAIVTARNKKLLKRLVATPMSRVEYLLSFLVSRLFFLVIEAAAILGFGALVFGIPFRGPPSVLAVTCLVGALAFAGLGLLIASRAKTTEGVSGLMNLVMLPMWIFSGVFFSAANFPPVLQPFIQALPLTALNDALRLTMLQGAGWLAVGPELAIVGAWMVGSFVLALVLFRWR